REQDGDRERQFRGAAALLLLAVQPSDDDERSKVSWPARLRAERQKGVAPFRARPLAVVLLPFARRHVVGRDDAAYGGRTLLVRRFSEPRADHDPHLALEIHAPCLRGQFDRRARWDHARWRLEEQERLGRHLIPHLLRVLAVVPADADDLSWTIHALNVPRDS